VAFAFKEGITMNLSYKTFILFLVFSTTIFNSCTRNEAPSNELESKMNKIAEAYVKLALKVGQHDPDFIDYYYGPGEWKPPELKHDGTDTLIHKQLDEETDSLLNEMDNLGNYKATELQRLRYRFLYKQLLAVKAKIFMLSGGNLSFDEESKALYDAVSPGNSEEYYEKILKSIDDALPGKGDISKRFEDFRSSFIIPPEKLDTVYKAAINECRKRTLSHIKLPSNENFKVEFVTGKPWSAYNWYKGNSFSLIQVNTNLPTYIDKAIDLAAHEGYPGHHVYNALLEKNLYREHGWVEFSVYVLFSPQSLIAEGTANYGIKVAFPGDSRIKFEREVLFPLAGLDSAKAEGYYKILDIMEKLDYAWNEAARNYLDGKWTRDEAKNYLVKYCLFTPERAEQGLRFADKYRSYVINYNLGQDIVKDYVEKKGGSDDNPERRWELFEYLLSTPQTPSGLSLASDKN
jgi:hypothetical protein